MSGIEHTTAGNAAAMAGPIQAGDSFLALADRLVCVVLQRHDLLHPKNSPAAA